MPDTPERPSIEREDLLRIVREVIPNRWSDHWRRRMLDVVSQAERLAVGAASVDGEYCPASLAVVARVPSPEPYPSGFALNYDRLVREHLNLGPEPVVVEVTDG